MANHQNHFSTNCCFSKIIEIETVFNERIICGHWDYMDPLKKVTMHLNISERYLIMQSYGVVAQKMSLPCTFQTINQITYKSANH